jgi:hypothetical protein
MNTGVDTMLAMHFAARLAAIAANAVSGVAALRLALELAGFGGTPARDRVPAHACSGDSLA